MHKKLEPKYKVSERKNGSRRFQTLLSDVQKTDQSFKNSCDINCIMDAYRKTGQFPHFREKIAQYMDLSNMPDFVEAHNVVENAKELFYGLPAVIRNAMNNDPAQLETFITNPANLPLLEKYDLVEVQRKVKGPMADKNGKVIPATEEQSGKTKTKEGESK